METAILVAGTRHEIQLEIVRSFDMPTRLHVIMQPSAQTAKFRPLSPSARPAICRPTTGRGGIRGPAWQSVAGSVVVQLSIVLLLPVSGCREASSLKPAPRDAARNQETSDMTDALGADTSFDLAVSDAMRTPDVVNAPDSNDGWPIAIGEDAGGFIGADNNRCLSPTAARYASGRNYAGYAFSFISLSPEPNDKLVCGFSDDPNAFCTYGQLARRNNDPTSLSEVAAVGINLNQSRDGEATANPLPWTIRSVTVGFTNPGGSELRLQVNQGSNYFCHDLSKVNGPVTILSDQFFDECWQGGWRGETWDGTGAVGLQLVVLSSA
jgi:hypothetical protein